MSNQPVTKVVDGLGVNANVVHTWVEVKYEDLIEKSAQELEKICEFIWTSYSLRMLDNRKYSNYLAVVGGKPMLLLNIRLSLAISSVHRRT